MSILQAQIFICFVVQDSRVPGEVARREENEVVWSVVNRCAAKQATEACSGIVSAGVSAWGVSECGRRSGDAFYAVHPRRPVRTS